MVQARFVYDHPATADAPAPGAGLDQSQSCDALVLLHNQQITFIVKLDPSWPGQVLSDQSSDVSRRH
jgi:hypothetical protein